MELWLSCTSWSWSSVAAATPSDKAAKIRLTTFKIFRESQLLKTLLFGKPSQFTCYIYKETCRSSHNETFVGWYFDVRTTTSFVVVGAPRSSARMATVEKWPSKSTSLILFLPPISLGWGGKMHLGRPSPDTIWHLRRYRASGSKIKVGRHECHFNVILVDLFLWCDWKGWGSRDPHLASVYVGREIVWMKAICREVTGG